MRLYEIYTHENGSILLPADHPDKKTALKGPCALFKQFMARDWEDAKREYFHLIGPR